MIPIAVAAAVAATLLAINMGASGLAPSFSAAIGAGLVRRGVAVVVYGGCVVAGAALLGERVAGTLARTIAPEEAFTPAVTVAVLLAVGVAMLGANLLRVPQSTSWVTVVAVVVVGAHAGQLELSTLYGRLLPAWLLLPVVSYLVMRLALRPLYPLRAANMRLHERLRARRPLLRGLVIASSAYVALAIGSNNVANIVGPLSASGLVGTLTGLVLVAPLFPLGALLLPGPTDTLARQIVPLGEVSAALCGLVVGTLLLGASLLGVPQSLVQLHAAAVLAVSRVKEGSVHGMPAGKLARIGLVWLAAPALAAALTRAALAVTS